VNWCADAFHIRMESELNVSSQVPLC